MKAEEPRKVGVQGGSGSPEPARAESAKLGTAASRFLPELPEGLQDWTGRPGSPAAFPFNHPPRFLPSFPPAAAWIGPGQGVPCSPPWAALREGELSLELELGGAEKGPGPD